ncbi:aminotransferase class I/II-fold pyridoxal phosphate-dependent enzyme [Sphingobacterium hotanense]|uniref:aminotransferase class I/II-fold pyridoxal phosphate-dependent enzyme n=1 Tax=Sphingobacterium hotanense TaxID=649196 RepID=UPI0011F135E1|nr:aminotransferase class I/II-fold pyridoxal phosphate-dependent enzyme [Sphingobacterium hotanense]
MKTFRNLSQPTGRTIHLDDQSYQFFGGTAYLGLLDNKDYIELFKEGIDRYGLNNGTSRTNNLQLGVYAEAEKFMAGRFGFEDAVLLSSGYLAAQVAVKSVVENRSVLYAPGAHPSLWIAEDPKVGLSFSAWKTEVIDKINNSSESDFVIISNAIDNLTPELFDFSDFQNIAEDKNVLLILDDSHGIGVLNKNALSTDLRALGAAKNIEIVVLASLAKGLGTDAGVVLGNAATLEKIRKHPIYMGASPSSPAALYALVHGNRIYESAFDKLHQNIDIAKALFSNLEGYHNIPNFPVFTSHDPNLYRYLVQHQVLISSFPYPLPTSPLLNRIVISALHEESDISQLAEVLMSQHRLKL